jgi:hypothetical protein
MAFPKQGADDLSACVVGVGEEDRRADEELRDRKEETHELVE